MATAAERMRILKMIEDKQISAADGARLLTALQGGPDEGEAAGGKPRWLRVRVTGKSSGKTKLNVTIPIGLLEIGMKMGAHFAPDLAGADLNAVQAAIKQGLQGRVIEVDDEEDDERVEVFVE